MATFPRGHSAHIVYTRNQETIRRAAGTPTTPAALMLHTAADGLTLRGIPAIGPGVAGAIPGTRPESVIRHPRYGATT